MLSKKRKMKNTNCNEIKDYCGKTKLHTSNEANPNSNKATV